jgi:hypothetical protein
LKKHLLTLGSILVFNHQEKSIRGSLVFITTNLLLLAALVFVVEVILIALGINNIFLPLTRAAHTVLSTLIY